MKKTSLVILIVLSGVFSIYAQRDESDIDFDAKVCTDNGGSYNYTLQRCDTGSSLRTNEASRLLFEQERTDCEGSGTRTYTPDGRCVLKSAGSPAQKCEERGGTYSDYTGVCIFSEKDRCEAVLRGQYVDGKCVSPSDIPVGNSPSFSSWGGTSPNASPGATLSTNGNQLTGLIKMVQDIIIRLVPILIGLAVLSFFWFLVQFIWKGADNPTERDKMKSGMAWSLLALFVMVSIWGIIEAFGKIVGVPQGSSIQGFKLPGQK